MSILRRNFEIDVMSDHLTNGERIGPNKAVLQARNDFLRRIRKQLLKARPWGKLRHSNLVE